jgi:hypothetical protein
MTEFGPEACIYGIVTGAGRKGRTAASHLKAGTTALTNRRGPRTAPMAIGRHHQCFWTDSKTERGARFSNLLRNLRAPTSRQSDPLILYRAPGPLLTKPREVDSKTVQGINFFAPVDKAEAGGSTSPASSVAAVAGLRHSLGALWPELVSAGRARPSFALDVVYEHCVRSGHAGWFNI